MKLGMNGPEKTENSFDVEKIGVRERESGPTIKVAYVNKSRVGERKTKPTTNDVASKNKSGVGESEIDYEPPMEQENKQFVLFANSAQLC